MGKQARSCRHGRSHRRRRPHRRRRQPARRGRRAGRAGHRRRTAASRPRTGPLQRALDKLVADEHPHPGPGRRGRRRRQGRGQGGRASARSRARPAAPRRSAVVAEALGSTPDEVKAGLKDGTSIAAQAEAKGVDRQVVDDALTAHLNGRIDAAVKDGKLTEERAAKAEGARRRRRRPDPRRRRQPRVRRSGRGN